MKKIVLLSLFAIIVTASFAQNYRGPRHGQGTKQGNGCNEGCRISNLTEDQQAAIKTERLNFIKNVQDEKNELNELRAKQRTIATTEPLDEKALNKCLASINKIAVSVQKKRVRHQQAVKALLNEEQVIEFDNRGSGSRNGMGGFRNGPGCNKAMHKGYGHGKMHGHGYRQGRGHGNSQGAGQGDRRGMGRGQSTSKAPGKGCGLTEDQLESVKASRVELWKKQQPLFNQLNELKAELKSITTGSNIDLKKVDKIIEQQGEVQLEIEKSKASHRSKVRKLLSDEQKAMFDRNIGMFGKGRFAGHGF